MRHLLMAAGLAILCVGATLATGQYRYGAFVGASSSSAAALVSLTFMMWSAGRHADRPQEAIRAALVVAVGMFLARILVVAAGTVTVVRGGSEPLAFVVAFFLPYFAFAAIEGAYVHSLTGTGRRVRA